MPRLAIIGLQLVGASLGMAVRQAKLFDQVVGYERDWSTSRRARKLGAVDKDFGSVEDAVRDADAVVLTVRPSLMREAFQEMAPLLKPGAVVSDTANTKSQVLRWADELLPRGVSFVGGHPLIDDTNPDADPSATLFAGRVYCLTPSVHANAPALEFMRRLVEAVGAEGYFLDLEEHDSFAAAVRQLPLVTAVALADLVTHSESWREISKIAGESFDQQVRLVTGDPGAYQDECFTNKENLGRWLDLYIARLRDMRQRVTAEDPDLEKEFEQHVERIEVWRHRKRQGNPYPGYESKEPLPPPIPRSIFSLGRWTAKSDRSEKSGKSGRR